MIFFLIFTSCFYKIGAQSVKRALLVGIGDYPLNTEQNQTWSDLSSENDLQLVSQSLSKQGFLSSNIQLLVNQNATLESLKNSFLKLIAESQLGDIVVFHFSGHGQQVTDIPKGILENSFLNQDENDGFDEALVLYDAPLKMYKGYKFEGHLIDDELNIYLSRLQLKVGKLGQVLVIIDACHSGTATRGLSNETFRGSSEKCIFPLGKKLGYTSEVINSDLDFQFGEFNQDQGTLTVFTGCKSYQVNREYYHRSSRKQFGSLSFAFSTGLSELRPNSTYQDLFESINQFITLEFNNAQQPELESDNLKMSVFGGAIIESEPYFHIIDFKDNILTLDAGLSQGVSNGDSIFIFPESYKSVPSNVQPTGRGIVIKSDIDKSTVILNSMNSQKISLKSKNNFRAFFNPANKIQTELFIKNSMNDKRIFKQLKDKFKSFGKIQFVEAGYRIILQDTLLESVGKPGIKIILSGSKLNLFGLPFKIIWNENSLDTVVRYIQNFAKIDIYRKLEFANSEIDFTVDLVKLGEVNLGNHNLRFQIGDTIKLKVKNTGQKSVYFDIIDIYPNSEVHTVDENLKSYQQRIGSVIRMPGDSFDYDMIIGPPCGMEQFKIIACTTKNDISPLTTLGQSKHNSRGFENNDIIQLISDNIENKNQPQSEKILAAESKISIKNIFFEINNHQN
jgi:hypothetical protein